MKAKIRKIVYLDIKQYLLSILICCIYFFINYTLYSNGYINASLDYIIYITISIGVIGLITIIYKMIKTKIIMITFITYVVLCINSFLGLLSVYEEVNMAQYKIELLFIIKTMFSIVLLINYSGKCYSKHIIIVRKVIFIWLLYLFMGYSLLSKDINIILIVLSVLNIFIIINSLKYYKGNRILLKKFINTVKVLFFVVLLTSIMCLYFIISSKVPKDWVILFFKSILFILIVTETIKAVKIIMLKPYKDVFRKLDRNIKDMIIINKEIAKKNIDLQVSKVRMNRNRTIIDSFFKDMPIPFVIIDEKSQRIMFTNKSFIELLQMKSFKEVINKKITSVVNLNTSDDLLNVDMIIEGEININGIHKYVEIEVFKDEGNKDEIVLFFMDVTEKINNYKLQETIRNKELEESIKRDFLSNISHDLKTPINVIYSAAQLMEVYRKKNNFEGIEKYNEISKINCISLIRFTDDIIDSSKIKSDFIKPKLEFKNIVEVIEDIVISLVEYAKHKNVNIVFDTDSEEIYIYLDTRFIERITLNIISNSIKYCKDDGDIIVSIKDGNDTVKVIFEDNGIGMDSDLLNSSFDRYYMGDNNKETKEKGTGIGLFVVKRLIEEQNGELNVFSEINKGTRFEIMFKKEKLSEEE